MSNVFNSRSEARKFASENGMKVVDRGSDLKECRWAVIAKGSVLGKAPKEAVSAVPDETYFEGTGDTSAFFSSRKEAREFSAKVNGKIIDHAKTSDGRDKGESVVKDLGKQGKRWEVVYTATDELWDDRVLGADGNYVRVSEVTVPDEKTVSTAEPVILMTLKNLQVTLPNGKSFVMSRSHEDFPLCARLFSEGKIDELIVAIDVDKKAKEWSFGEDIKVIEGTLYHYGMEVNSSIAKRIVDDCEAGIDPQKYVNFFRKMMKNSSYKAVKMVYDFIQHNDLSIMEDGNIKAWKMINSSGYDCYTGKVPNFKGITVSMPRNLVEDDPEVTCSNGLHVAAKEYFKHCFGNETLIEVSVSPENIVSVPTDYNNSKCRCCEYTVLTGKEKPSDLPDFVMVDEKGNRIDGRLLLDRE